MATTSAAGRACKPTASGLTLTLWILQRTLIASTSAYLQPASFPINAHAHDIIMPTTVRASNGCQQEPLLSSPSFSTYIFTARVSLSTSVICLSLCTTVILTESVHLPDCSNYYVEQSPVCVPHQLNWRDTLQRGKINLWLPYLWREAAEVTSISDIVLTASKK